MKRILMILMLVGIAFAEDVKPEVKVIDNAIVLYSQRYNELVQLEKDIAWEKEKIAIEKRQIEHTVKALSELKKQTEDAGADE